MKNRIEKLLAGTCSILLSLNATTLALEKNEVPNSVPSKQEVSSDIKKDHKKSSKKPSAKKAGTGLAIGGAVCLGIERLVTRKWFPLIRACIPHHSHDRNVLVVSKDIDARQKFTRIMFEGTRGLGYFTREYTYAPENSAAPHSFPINYYVHPGIDEFSHASLDFDMQNGYHIRTGTSEKWKFECIVVAVDGDQEREQVEADIRRMIAFVCEPRGQAPCEVIVAICTDRQTISNEDPFFADISNVIGHLEQDYLSENRGLGPERNGRFLQSCTLNSSRTFQSNMAAMIDENYVKTFSN